MIKQQSAVVLVCVILACKPQLEVGSCVQVGFSATDVKQEINISSGGLLRFRIKENGVEKGVDCNVTIRLDGKTIQAIGSRHCFQPKSYANGKKVEQDLVSGSFSYLHFREDERAFWPVEVEDPDIVLKDNSFQNNIKRDGFAEYFEKTDDYHYIGLMHMNHNTRGFNENACFDKTPKDRNASVALSCFSFLDLVSFKMELKDPSGIPQNVLKDMSSTLVSNSSFQDVERANQDFMKHAVLVMTFWIAQAQFEDNENKERIEKLFEFIDKYAVVFPDSYRSWKQKILNKDKTIYQELEAQVETSTEQLMGYLARTWDQAHPRSELILDIIGKPFGQNQAAYRYGLKLGISKGTPQAENSIELLRDEYLLLLRTARDLILTEHGDSGAILRAGDRIIGVLSTLNGEPIRRVSDIPIPQADEESSGSVDDLLSDDETSEDLNSEGSSQENKQEDLLAENSTPRTSESSTSKPNPQEQTSSSQPAPSDSQSGKDTSFFEDLLGGLKEIADNQPEEKDEPSARQERESWYDPDLSAKDPDRRRDGDDRRIAQDSALAPVPEAEWDRVFNPSAGSRPNCTP